MREGIQTCGKRQSDSHPESSGPRSRRPPKGDHMPSGLLDQPVPAQVAKDRRTHARASSDLGAGETERLPDLQVVRGLPRTVWAPPTQEHRACSQRNRTEST